MPHVLLALGSNLGDRAATLDRALAALAVEHGITLVRRSQAIETAAIGGPTAQLPYLNAAAVVETSLAPQDLLDRLLQIESALGRVRHQHWGPRTIDLDLLLYDDLVVETPQLVIPHPRMAYRRFVLEPAAEIAGSWRHPRLGWTIDELLAHARTEVPSVEIVGCDQKLVDRVAHEVARRSGLRVISGPSGRAAGTPVEFVAQLAQGNEAIPHSPKLLVMIDRKHETGRRAPCPIVELTGDNVPALCDEIVAAIAAIET